MLYSRAPSLAPAHLMKIFLPVKALTEVSRHVSHAPDVANISAVERGSGGRRPRLARAASRLVCHTASPKMPWACMGIESVVALYR